MSKDLNQYPLWTAIVTPLDNEGRLDLESYKNLLNEQNEAKNGILVLGSTGESLNLSLEERRKVLAFTLEQNLDVPIMVGVGGAQLEATLDWVKEVSSKNIDALLLVTPLYAKPETEGQYLWFKTLMDATDKKVMLYNVPSRTGKGMSFDAVKRLNEHPNFWAIKEASGSVDDFKNYVASAGGKPVYSGDDGLLPVFAEHGCRGLVSVSSNAWPKETHEYTVRSLEKTLSKEEISLWDACAGALFCVSNPIPVKRLLSEEKRIAYPNLKLPLTHKDLSQAATVLEASSRIKDWLKAINK
jgi:4-hydroxy-tetrahydrodipicolinate synthase